MATKSEAVKEAGSKAAETAEASMKAGLAAMDQIRDTYGDLFLIGMIVMGLVLAFGGIRLFKHTLGAMSGLFFWFYRQQFLFEAKTTPMLVLAVAMSIAVGLVAFYLVRIGVRMFGGMVGGFGGYYIFLWARGIIGPMLVEKMSYSPESMGNYVVMILFVGLGVAIGIYYIDDVIETVMLVVCPLMGSFLFVNGIGGYLGGLPMWQALPSILVKFEFNLIEKSHKYYLMLLILLTCLSAYYQYIKWYNKGFCYYTKSEIAEDAKED